jgi:hypothetical protein
MCREIQNPQIFQQNPESFSRAIIFRMNTNRSPIQVLTVPMLLHFCTSLLYSLLYFCTHFCTHICIARLLALEFGLLRMVRQPKVAVVRESHKLFLSLTGEFA